MESFTELLTDAFAETSGPSFAGEDLDFENLNFDGNCEEDEAEGGTPRRDGALLQEAAGEAAGSFGDEAEDEVHAAGKAYREDDFRGVSLKEGYTSSEEESDEEESDEEESSSGDDEEEEDEEEPGELLASVHCTDEVCEKEDGVAAEGQPLAPESAGNPRVSNKGRREAEGHEELSYFGRAPEEGSETAEESDSGAEDEQEDDTESSPEPANEGVTIEPEVESEQDPDRPAAAAGLDFHCVSLQDLTAEVDEGAEKMKEFSGDEHQEAGESFADYPSDFSSCEYAGDGGRDRDGDGKADASAAPPDRGSYSQLSGRLDGDVRDVAWSRGTEDAEEGHDAGWASLNATGVQEKPAAVELVEADGDETGESDSYSSSDYDDVNVRRRRRSSSEDTLGNWGPPDPGDRNQTEDSDDRLMANSRVNPAETLCWDFYDSQRDVPPSESVLTADTHQTQTHTWGADRRHTGDDNSYSMVKREDIKRPSSVGSLDDGFFFDAGVETSGVAERENNESEEERNWEQEQERIKAFYDYYDDSDDEPGRGGRQTRVQFCADPLSQVIRYETDSDGDSLSSFTDREDDQSSSDELGEPGNTQQQKPESDLLSARLQDGEPNAGNTHIRARRHRCLGTMRLMLKMGLVLAAGLLMFWLATDEADWLHQAAIF